MVNQFLVRFVPKEYSAHPERLCGHNCDRTIQFISQPSGEIVGELCVMDAETMAKDLLEALEEGSKNLSA